MKQSWRHYGQALALTGMLCGASAYAFAADTKRYPGTMCMETGPGSYYDISYRDNGSVENASSIYNATVVCPIVRDHTGAGEGWSSATVWVDNQHPYEGVSCTFKVVAPTGVLNQQTKHSTGTGLKTLTFSGNSCSSCIGDPSGTGYVLVCTIPPLYRASTSKILSYSVTERD